VSPVIAAMFFVAIAVALASVLHVSTSGLISSGGGGHSCVGPQVRIQATDAEWLVEILTVAPGTRPAAMFLEVTTPDGTVALARTALSALTPESGAVYRDMNPQDDEVRPGDGIGLETARFLEGSRLAISDGGRSLTVRLLE
jgi:hypothetical protein